LLVGGSRYDNAAWFSYGLKTSRDIHAITVEIACLDHYIAKVDAYPEHDLRIVYGFLVSCRHGLLQLDGALDRLDGAGELNQYPIPHDFE
jgi:hypothetical protein